MGQVKQFTKEQVRMAVHILKKKSLHISNP